MVPLDSFERWSDAVGAKVLHLVGVFGSAVSRNTVKLWIAPPHQIAGSKFALQ
jgi:hypothetical protein